MGGGKAAGSEISAGRPDTFAPVAPERTSPGQMPDNVDKALFTSGVKTTAAQKKKQNQGTSRLVIPLEGSQAQLGSEGTPRDATGVV